MKVLFIQPPIQDFYNTRFREYPLGLLYLAGALESNGALNKGLLDARDCNKPKKIQIPDELKYLEKYYTKENNLFLNYKHFGLSFDEISSRVKEFNPDVVCINSMFTTYNAQVIEMAKSVKNAVPDCAVIVGGYHATVVPQTLIDFEFIDTVVRGEGEYILAQIFNSTETVNDVNDDVISLKKMKGRILDNNGVPFYIHDLDSLSFPARHLLDASKYRFNKKPYTMILTSRGCPNSCVFCCVHSMAGNKYRMRNIDSVLNEVDECIKRYGIEVFDFQDDNLLFDVDRIKIMLEKIISRYGKRKLELLATNGLNSSNIDEELLMLMKDAGFNKLDISLATGAVSSRSSLKRPETIAQYENVVEKANYLGLDITTYIIIGLPEQPLDELKQTVNYLNGKNTLISPSVFYNVPGMPIYEQMKKHEYLDSDIARRSTAFNSRGDDFERDDIFKIFEDIRKNNFLLRH